MPSCVGMVEHVQSEETRGRLRAHWRDYISCLALEPLGIPKEELEDVENDSGVSLLNLLPLGPKHTENG